MGERAGVWGSGVCVRLSAKEVFSCKARAEPNGGLFFFLNVEVLLEYRLCRVHGTLRTRVEL